MTLANIDRYEHNSLTDTVMTAGPDGCHQVTLTEISNTDVQPPSLKQLLLVTEKYLFNLS